jgi:hypothetical protein
VEKYKQVNFFMYLRFITPIFQIIIALKENIQERDKINGVIADNFKNA